MDEGGEAGDLFAGETESRHSLVGSPMQYHLADLVSRNIRGDQLGPRKIRTGFSTAGIPAVAEGAILREERTAGGD
jgi:hypothetical protein